MMRKSLIVKLGAIGDVAMVLPAAWTLHQAGSQIDWLCGTQALPLLSCYSWVHPILINDKRLLGGSRLAAVSEMLRTWWTLLGSSYDLCALLQYDRRYRLLTLPVRARRSVALDRDARAFHLVSERHHTWEYARILGDMPDGYCAENIAPVLPDRLPENPLPRTAKTRVALVPGGARNLLRDDPQRRWPVESYVELAKLLLDSAHEVVLTGGPGDAWAASYFAGLPVDNRIGAWAIPQTLAFYNSCDCVVTHDTGPMHLAGLTRCALVGLFGPTAPSKSLPRRQGVVGLWGGERLPCRPCYDGREYAPCKWNGCMISISSQRVAAAVQNVLANPTAEWRVESL
jgi:heptosyltransferase-2